MASIPNVNNGIKGPIQLASKSLYQSDNDTWWVSKEKESLYTQVIIWVDPILVPMWYSINQCGTVLILPWYLNLHMVYVPKWHQIQYTMIKDLW